MNAPLYKIGDKVKRIDCDDTTEYTIDKIKKLKDSWIYSMEGQGWADGWAWVFEWNIKRHINSTKNHPKIDLRQVSSIPASGCPFQTNDGVACYNHTGGYGISNKTQYICVCRSD